MTRIVPDRLTPEMHDALLDKVSSADGLHPDAGYEAAIAASPGHGAVTVQQLEAAAEAFYAAFSDPFRGELRELSPTMQALWAHGMRAALSAIGLTVQP